MDLINWWVRERAVKCTGLYHSVPNWNNSDSNRNITKPEWLQCCGPGEFQSKYFTQSQDRISRTPAQTQMTLGCTVNKDSDALSRPPFQISKKRQSTVPDPMLTIANVMIDHSWTIHPLLFAMQNLCLCREICTIPSWQNFYKAPGRNDRIEQKQSGAPPLQRGTDLTFWAMSENAWTINILMRSHI